MDNSAVLSHPLSETYKPTDPPPLARQHVQASIHLDASWSLPEPNDVWSLPDTNKVELLIRKSKDINGSTDVHSIRGLVVDLSGRIYGERTMGRIRAKGHEYHGRVAVGCNKYPAFTGTQVFNRPDGNRVEVGVIIVAADSKKT